MFDSLGNLSSLSECGSVKGNINVQDAAHPKAFTPVSNVLIGKCVTKTSL